MKQLIVIGGGAAGFFGALAAKEKMPIAEVVLLEKSGVVLSKVKVSGGGRCNVTHACFDPKELVTYYPRGHKELLGPFHHFQPHDTITWFETRGVLLKREKDGRMFPVTNLSATIIECLLHQAEKLGVEIRLRQKIEKIEKKENLFTLHLKEGGVLQTERLLLATGSSQEGYQWAKELGHTIQEPVPSLFTFNIPQFSLSHLSGIAVENASVSLPEGKLSQQGPLLITHFGLSGPAVLKLSAWGARFLHACQYKTECVVNWLPHLSEEEIFQHLRLAKEKTPQQLLAHASLFPLPKNLWRSLTEATPLITLSDKTLRSLAHQLHASTFHICGKTTHKEEFVTCGGVTLSEVDFKTMQSKISPGLFFAGEILDIDGVTGGFNFQNAWTSGYIAGHSCS